MTQVVIASDPETGALAPDFWNLRFDVYPTTRGASTEVMLVQSLLVGYFLNPTLPPSPGRAKAMRLISSFGKGFAFADGVYGPATREVLRVFEEDSASPFKDGIVRRVPLFHTTSLPDTKLKRLNSIWNMTLMGTAGATKEDTGRAMLPPVLFNDLYSNVIGV